VRDKVRLGLSRFPDDLPVVMEKEGIIQALHQLLKAENDTTEDVFYNAGIIDAIKEVEKLALIHKLKKTPTHFVFLPYLKETKKGKVNFQARPFRLCRNGRAFYA
jgi:hypothetical protein